MKKAWAKKELENSTLLNPSSILFSTDGQAQSSVKELYSRALFNLFIYCAGKKKERRRKKMKPILTVLQRAPPRPKGKKRGRAGLMIEEIVFCIVRFSSLSSGLVFFWRVWTDSSLSLCILLIVSSLTTTASLFSKWTWKMFLLNQKKDFCNACLWLQQKQFYCQAELAQWCLSFQSKPSHNHFFKLHVDKAPLD